MIVLSLVFFLQWNLEEERSQNLNFWLQQLERASSEDVRINALAKIAEIKDESAIDDLARSLASDNARIRYHSARSLAKIPSDQSLEALQSRLQNESDIYIQAEIKRSIEAIEAFFEKTRPSFEEDQESSEDETSAE